MQICRYAALANLAVFSLVSGQTQPIESVLDDASVTTKDSGGIPPSFSPLAEGEVDAREQAPSPRASVIPGLRAVSIVAKNLGMPRLAEQVAGMNRIYGNSVKLGSTVANALGESVVANQGLEASAHAVDEIPASLTGDGSSAPERLAARAPEESKAPRKASAPASNSVEGDVKAAPFKGKPLVRTEVDLAAYAQHVEEVKKAKADKREDPLPFPVIYLDQLANLNDKQAYEIFHRGTAEIPSAISESMPLRVQERWSHRGIETRKM